MIQLVKDAQQEKPDIQRLADRISAIFVPVVLGIAVLTLVISYFFFNIPFSKALMNSIAVLVISCPCAMGLATPTAVMVGVGRVAQNGILIRGGQTLELFAEVKKMVFDKTGTLTTGDFAIEKIHYFQEDKEETNAIIYALEHYSSHPIAASILKALPDFQNKMNIYNKAGIDSYDLVEAQEIKGRGVVAKDKHGNRFEIGSYEVAKHLTKVENHAIYLIKNNELLATIDLADDIKEGAVEMIQNLKLAGIQAIMLSGDKSDKVEAVAKQLDIKEYYAEQSPEEKLKKIEQLSNNEITAMVGDGINDAPALAKATVGVSLSDASQAAIQSAQIVLLNGKLENLTKAHTISKATLTTIKQNLFWAFAYNIVAIPIAAMGFLNPMWGAFFMAFSDVVVIGNSLRLKTRKL
jgi:Cu+-exporting ATPase